MSYKPQKEGESSSWDLKKARNYELQAPERRRIKLMEIKKREKPWEKPQKSHRKAQEERRIMKFYLIFFLLSRIVSVKTSQKNSEREYSQAKGGLFSCHSLTKQREQDRLLA